MDGGLAVRLALGNRGFNSSTELKVRPEYGFLFSVFQSAGLYNNQGPNVMVINGQRVDGTASEASSASSNADHAAPRPTNVATCLVTTPQDAGIEALDESLSRLALEQPKLAELVQLRYFGGLTLAQSAEFLGVSARTADTWWAYARAWFAVELKDE